MNEFVRSNKIRGIRWLKTPIENVKIRIKLKTQDSILTLPKFEDYRDEASNLNLEHNIDKYVFKWQEKRLSKSEYKFYRDIHNCVTDLDMHYNDLTKDGNDGQKVFSYIHDDSYLPLPDKREDVKSWIGKINEKMKSVFMPDSVSLRHLFRSEESICMAEDQWTAMHVVFDNSTYEDSDLLLKQEITLLSLFYNQAKHCLIISPETNDLEMNPYTIELDNDMVLDYHYSIELMIDEQCDDDGNDEEFVLLLQKLYEKWTKKHMGLVNFTMPPVGKKHFYITLEIVTTCNFDMDNIYIEYHIKIPDEVTCNDSRTGRTHVSEASVKDGGSIWHYGHMVELTLEMDNDIEPKPIKVFFEVISSDWWGRHRTEGYSYVFIPLAPGGELKNLICLRPDELGPMVAENRRLFLGGCHLLKDLDVLIQPEKDPSIIYQSTGQISIRWSTICQSSTLSSLTHPTPGPSTASALLVGADAALTQYRKARAKLKAATRDLEAGDG